jgi:hypothetical protein
MHTARGAASRAVRAPPAVGMWPRSPPAGLALRGLRTQAAEARGRVPHGGAGCALYPKHQGGVARQIFLCAPTPDARGLPAYVECEFYDYLQCGVLAYDFLRLGCDTCHQELLLAFSCKRRGFCFAPPVPGGAWLRPPPTWSSRSSPGGRRANGSCRCLFPAVLDGCVPGAHRAGSYHAYQYPGPGPSARSVGAPDLVYHVGPCPWSA